MTDVLTHPLILLLVGAVLTGILFPWLSRQSQERKQALDLKTSLVSEMTESVVSLLSRVAAVRVLQSWLPSSQAKLDAAVDEMNADYFRFRSTGSVIGVKLSAYFPESEVTAEWQELNELVLEVYALEGIHDEDRRKATQVRIRGRLQERYPDLLIADDWGEITEKWAQVQDALMRFQSDLARRILRERVRPVRG